MSGISKPQAVSLSQLEEVLDRQTPINSLDALRLAIEHKHRELPALENIAIGIDSSVFLDLAKHPKSADIIDYLNTKHTAPLILPGQAIQEFWNNHLSAIQTLSAGIKRKFDDLKKDVSKLDPNFGSYASDIDALLDGFNNEYGYVYDERTLRSTSSLLDLLKAKAIVSYVPRMRFHSMAQSRKLTKTPPGFRDETDGDFYIWLDFLYGLMEAKNSKKKFVHAVILTHDRKPDWSRANVAHPLLSAEVQMLVNVPFDIWTIDQFYKLVQKQTSDNSQSDITEPTA